MRAAGIHTVQSPAEIGHTVARVLGGRKAAKPSAKKKTAAKAKRR